MKGATLHTENLKICLVKQNTTYDLYTNTEGCLESIVKSSNWRLGPIGLWEAFDVDFRIVNENDTKECKIGKSHWNSYVKNWDIWPSDKDAENSEQIDWSQYDIVISIDIAVPSKIVKKFRDVMWCYYFIEGGTAGIDTVHKGSPFYGYNVFFNHRLPSKKLTQGSKKLQSMITNRRAVLDFPYYLLSSRSIRNVYSKINENLRDGIMLSHHSYKVISETEKEALGKFGVFYNPQDIYKSVSKDSEHSIPWQWQQVGLESISDLHNLQLRSKYLIIHPKSRIMAGLALIEAVSAGCLALAPKELVIGFPELISNSLNYTSFENLLFLLRELEDNPSFYNREKQLQCEKVDEICYNIPITNLITLYGAFNNSKTIAYRQRISEYTSYLGVRFGRIVKAISRHIGNAFAVRTLNQY